ncbi:hypothetical protein MRX96_042497 [Rhipicephalus microplus]
MTRDHAPDDGGEHGRLFGTEAAVWKRKGDYTTGQSSGDKVPTNEARKKSVEKSEREKRQVRTGTAAIFGGVYPGTVWKR